MYNVKFISLILITLFQTVLAFAQEGYHDYDQDTEPRIPKFIDVTAYIPHFTITKEDALNMMLSGLKLTKEGKAWSKAIKAGEILIEVAGEIPKKSVEHSNEQYDEQIILISKDAQRLEELHKSGVVLSKNWEAGDILNRLRQNPKGEEDAFLFARKAILSKFTLYTVAQESGSKYLANKLFWKEEKKPTDLTKTMWKRLKVQSDFVNKYMKTLSVELSKIAAEKTIKGLFDKTFDDFVNGILAKSHTQSLYVTETYFRQEIYLHPEICLPEIHLLAAAEPAQPAVEAVRPALLIAPARIYRYRDKVVNSFSVEQQVINRNYQVPSNPSYHSETIPTNENNTSTESGPSESEIQKREADHQEYKIIGDGIHYDWGPLSTSGPWDGRKKTNLKDESH